jgi:hypothetical protein
MTRTNETPDTAVEVVTAKRRITLPHIPVKKAIVTTLSVVGAVSLVVFVKNRLHAGEDDSDLDVEVETSEV